MNTKEENNITEKEDLINVNRDLHTCPFCGATLQPNGVCWVCPNCGTTTGCS